jgi:hypothetical protein
VIRRVHQPRPLIAGQPAETLQALYGSFVALFVMGPFLKPNARRRSARFSGIWQAVAALCAKCLYWRELETRYSRKQMAYARFAARLQLALTIS